MNLFFYQLKQAYLSLKQKPGFVFSVVSTMGITLGALLCVLTLAYVMLIKPLPYPEQEKLFWVEHGLSDKNNELRASWFSYPGMVLFSETQDIFTEFAMLCFGESILSSDPEQPLVNTSFVTPDTFSMLGAKIALGRSFEQTESIDTNNPVALISFETWQDDFAGSKDVLKEKVTINNVSFNIVGVIAPSFVEPEMFTPGRKTQYWLPWDYNFKAELYKNEWGNVLYELGFVGKLKSGLTPQQAEQKIALFLNEIWQENVASIAFYNDWQVKLSLKPLKSIILADNQQRMYLLLAGVIGLLVIACVNISNLFIARTVEKQQQLAINAAVGASKKQLFLCLLAESTVLMVASMAVALVVAALGFGLLQHYLAEFLPRVQELAINNFTLSAAVFFLLVFALSFAKINSQMINYHQLNERLQSSGKGTGVQVSKAVRQILIASQVTVTSVLVFANLTLFDSAVSVINTPMKYNVEQVMALELAQAKSIKRGSAEAISLIKEVQKSLALLPQVLEVSQSNSPLDSYATNFIQPSTKQIFSAEIQAGAGHNYINLLQQRLLAGDWFSEQDIAMSGNHIFVVNDVFAKQLSPDGNVVGMKINMEGEIDQDNNAVHSTIIGVVSGVNIPDGKANPAQVYRPIWRGFSNFLIKVKPGQTLSREQIAASVKLVTSQFTLARYYSLSDRREQMLFSQYITAITSGVLAVFTFILAAIGLYGILSYSTQVRRYEIGTRMAIGAKSKDIIKLIFKDNTSALVAGIVTSLFVLLGVFFGFSELLTSYISFELLPLLIITLALISLLSFFACYLPLRQYIYKPASHSLRGAE